MSVEEYNIMERLLTERGKMTLIKEGSSYRMGVPDETSPVFKWQWFSGSRLGGVLQAVNKATEGLASSPGFGV